MREPVVGVILVLAEIAMFVFRRRLAGFPSGGTAKLRQ